MTDSSSYCPWCEQRGWGRQDTTPIMATSPSSQSPGGKGLSGQGRVWDPESRKRRGMWKPTVQSAFQKFALQRVPRKGETETGSWLCSELHEFPKVDPGFSLLLKPVLARGHRALHSPEDYPLLLCQCYNPARRYPALGAPCPAEPIPCSSRCPPSKLEALGGGAGVPGERAQAAQCKKLA